MEESSGLAPSGQDPCHHALHYYEMMTFQANGKFGGGIFKEARGGGLAS